MAAGLSGRYAWPAQALFGVTVLLFLLVAGYAFATAGGWGWIAYGTGGALFFAGMLVLYARPVPVLITPQGVFIRYRRVDVTRRIRFVRWRSPELLVIDFNPLYQLRVTGEAAQVRAAWAILAARFPAQGPGAPGGPTGP
ncbi:conserved protein of unknown function [Candidatus Hydrogenisulfobacillus filiaventi]|uniref:Uncharacterized protein n=1 Tax=Candidatus Hydrogenisulfobacillus filiaventi TaxID=2707344 RepID=A0A6F8ZG44_9FIRM|nr:hypothetical protein [Bacillota bacterium]CAB1128606.1 conserved protein of unknown function [Candidatus Hydrogenisulfobacillus filiaventi]